MPGTQTPRNAPAASMGRVHPAAGPSSTTHCQNQLPKSPFSLAQKVSAKRSRSFQSDFPVLLEVTGHRFRESTVVRITKGMYQVPGLPHKSNCYHSFFFNKTVGGFITISHPQLAAQSGHSDLGPPGHNKQTLGQSHPAPPRLCIPYAAMPCLAGLAQRTEHWPVD